MLKNMALCYFNLQLYEDAIQFCDLALKVDQHHEMVSYVKAMSYAMLDKYEECKDILNQYGDLKPDLK